MHPDPYDDTTPVTVPGESWPSPQQPAQRRPKRGLRLAAGTTAAALLVAGGVGIGTAIAATRSTGTTTAASGQAQQQAPTSGPVYGGSQTDPAIFGQQETGKTTASGSQLTGLVRIQTTLGYANGEAAGTGMILSSDGEVVTNHHVIAGATKIVATVMSTGRSYQATLVGSDTSEDIAVIKLDGASGLSTITPDEDAVATGDAVTAVGDAGGAETLSAATGTVSALDQTIRTSSEGTTAGERLDGLIEIDADVISGDSGGATYDGQGEVVGMTTAASSGTSNITGYAIPIADVLKVAGDLDAGTSGSSYTYGYPAFLGIGLAQGGTATVQGVYAGTAADEAGITAGDTITSVDGTRVAGGTDLSAAIAALSPGDQVQVTWTDAQGAAQQGEVTLGTGPAA